MAANVPRKRNWFFTLNNYTPEDIVDIPKWFEAQKTLWVFQEEIGDNGTPHLQGCVMFNNAKKLTEMKRGIPRAHWEVCRNKKAAVAYCTKVATRAGEIYTNMPNIRPLIDPLVNQRLYVWQQELACYLRGPVDNRKIIWIWETVGNTGKTTFAKHSCMQNDGSGCTPHYIYLNGKAADVKYAITQLQVKPDVVFWDLTRTKEDYVSYQGIEEVKNGIFFSTKYESGMCMFNPPHLVIFANFPPDMTKLSADRWAIYTIDANLWLVGAYGVGALVGGPAPMDE